MTTSPAKKKKNNAVQFYRMMFCFSFAAIHVFQVYPNTIGMKPAATWCLDTMLPFMAFSGFFLMQGYHSKKARAERDGISLGSPSAQAWKYLVSRYKALWPCYAIGLAEGMLVTSIKRHIPLKDIPLWFLNALGEWTGINRN